MKKATQKSSPNDVSQHDCIKLGVLSHIQSRFIPHMPTKARLLLQILSDGLPHSTQNLTLKLGSDPRSARQALAKNKYGHWHIINVAGKSKQGKYKLDPRHLSRLDGDDSKARNEGALAYYQHSRKTRESGAVGLPKIIEMEQQAQTKVEADKGGL
jgi:hypothetical protein